MTDRVQQVWYETEQAGTATLSNVCLDSATLDKAAGRMGMVDPGIRQAWPGGKVCGLAVTVEGPPCDNLRIVSEILPHRHPSM
jgi:regulator of RNase E activity RraA